MTQQDLRNHSAHTQTVSTLPISIEEAWEQICEEITHRRSIKSWHYVDCKPIHATYQSLGLSRDLHKMIVLQFVLTEIIKWFYKPQLPSLPSTQTVCFILLPTINQQQDNKKHQTHRVFTFIMRNLLLIEMHCFTIMVNLQYLLLQAHFEQNSTMFMEVVKDQQV